jgi:hypothetical protein
VDVRQAIRDAEALLPGEPTEEGEDPRWQAIMAVGDHIESDPESVWSFILRWAGHPQEDLRSAIATCLLEHILEHHFSTYFPQVEQAALADALFADTFQRCWKFGEAEAPGNAERFDNLLRRLRKHGR